MNAREWWMRMRERFFFSWPKIVFLKHRLFFDLFFHTKFSIFFSICILTTKKNVFFFLSAGAEMEILFNLFFGRTQKLCLNSHKYWYLFFYYARTSFLFIVRIKRRRKKNTCKKQWMKFVWTFWFFDKTIDAMAARWKGRMQEPRLGENKNKEMENFVVLKSIWMETLLIRNRKATRF